jgi:hypothetical protein
MEAIYQLDTISRRKIRCLQQSANRREGFEDLAWLGRVIYLRDI